MASGFQIRGVSGIMNQVLHLRGRIYAGKQWHIVKWFHDCGSKDNEDGCVQGINYSSKGYRQGRLARL
jgi:hypothetical protein